MPPSTARAVPVVDADSGDARYAIACATSSALTSRPIGWRGLSALRSATGSGAWSSSRPTHGVSAVPGLTQLTRIPSRTWSQAIARVSDSTAPFDALYTARCGRPAVAAIEQVLTIAAAGGVRRGGWEVGEGGAGDAYHPHDVHVEHPQPLVVGVVGDGADGADTGVVDDDVQ